MRYTNLVLRVAESEPQGCTAMKSLTNYSYRLTVGRETLAKAKVTRIKRSLLDDSSLFEIGDDYSGFELDRVLSNLFDETDAFVAEKTHRAIEEIFYVDVLRSYRKGHGGLLMSKILDRVSPIKGKGPHPTCASLICLYACPLTRDLLCMPEDEKAAMTPKLFKFYRDHGFKHSSGDENVMYRLVT